MHSIEPPYSEMSDWVEQEEAEARERARGESVSPVEDQAASVNEDLPEAEWERGVNEGFDKGGAGYGAASTDRERPSHGFEGEKSAPSNAANGSSAGLDDGDTPRKVPVVKAPEQSFRPPMTPRKNVIPSRRAAFDPARAAAAGQAGPPPVSQARAGEPVTTQAMAAESTPAAPPARAQAVPHTPVLPAESTPASVPAAAPVLSGSLPVAPVEPAVQAAPITPAEPGLPLEKLELAADAGEALEAGSGYRADLPEYGSLPAMYHDTSAAEQAWLPEAYHDTSAAEQAWRVVDRENEIASQETSILPATPRGRSAGQESVEAAQRAATADIDTRKIAAPLTPLPPVAAAPGFPTPATETMRSAPLIDAPTTPLPQLAPVKPLVGQRRPMTRGRALLLAALLAILLVNALAASFNQSFGAQGWASVWDSNSNSNQNLLTQIAKQLQHSPTPGGGTVTAVPTQSPTQIVNLLLSQMTLDEKIGQMMMVQFTGPDYSPQLDAMVSQYKVGSVLFFYANGNIVSKSQVKNLAAQIQKNSFLPMAISIDQEGGTVDRLVNLDGPQPAAATIGATGNPNKAYQQGIKDSQDLASYGFNVNLAPVVDVTNVYNPQLYNRTYGNNAAIVTSMAGAYLKGLQKSGKVVGTLKHFPGLGDVSVDPHYRPPDLQRSLNDLNAIDWAPYSNLIAQGNVYAIMVTHEYVRALDTSEPSSLSPKVIGVLRNQMHFQGVIMTDSLTMESISNFYSPGQAAAMAVEAGDDMLMGAYSPDDVATMLKGIKQAITDGKISQARIDDSVRRILLLKYQLGLIHV